ncbi:hypothetical protein SCHPADRAFT_946283 [Schizopora paradoxa]|uniref:Uncharacterized protein n=1 Tax=Schizopora paradoxa TaxID=27342 RepID=A0A0H2R9P1_9AGAM|nr:hypothetical protein SCHPADRAFT_946283 [Schizopora paradoxa]
MSAYNSGALRNFPARSPSPPPRRRRSSSADGTRLPTWNGDDRRFGMPKKANDLGPKFSPITAEGRNAVRTLRGIGVDAGSTTDRQSQNSSQTSLEQKRNSRTIMLEIMEKLIDMNHDLQNELAELKARLRIAAGGHGSELPSEVEDKRKAYFSLRKDLEDLKAAASR